MKKQTNSTTKSRMTVLLTRQLLKRFAGVDGAIITATHPTLSQAENRNRNKEIFSALYASHYNMTPVKNAEGYTFVVENTVKDLDFFKIIKKLCERYTPSKVLFIRANSDNSTATFYDIHRGKTIDNATVDSELLQQLAKIPFAFECQTQAERNAVWHSYENSPTNWMGRWACSQQGKLVLQSL